MGVCLLCVLCVVR